MKVLVCGGRDFEDKEQVYDILDSLVLSGIPIECIVEGGARGADALAAQWAKERDVHLITVKAEWNKYGRSAGYRRNVQMLSYLGIKDIVIAFKGGKGTAMMVKLARDAGVDVYDYS